MKYILVFGLIGLALILATLSRMNPLSSEESANLPKATQASQTTELPPLQLASVFDGQEPVSRENTTRLLVTGDVLPARDVNNTTVTSNNFRWPYEKTFERLQAADITFINLETPLVPGCQPTVEGMIFCGDQRNVEGLVFAGVDVASIANNHALNQGEDGFLITQQLLEENGIVAVGDQDQPKIVTSKGTKFAFLAYNDVGEQSELLMAAAQQDRIRKDILVAKEQADVVILQFHWGEEYRRLPTGRQQELAHFAVDAGADLVLGNHPHWYQSVEMYKDKFIAYSHGNFVFDQMWSLETRLGVVGEYVFEGATLVDVLYHPVQIEDYGQPRWLEGEEKEKILEELRRASFELRDMKSSGDLSSSM